MIDLRKNTSEQKYFSWVVTAIGKDGNRVLVGANQGPHYPTREKAEQHIKDMYNTNGAERVHEIVGHSLEVREVETWGPNGDAKRTVFP